MIDTLPQVTARSPYTHFPIEIDDNNSSRIRIISNFGSYILADCITNKKINKKYDRMDPNGAKILRRNYSMLTLERLAHMLFVKLTIQRVLL